MLHPIKPVTCLTEMNNLLQFQRGVLELCIHLSQGNPYTEATFKNILGDAAGSWFWKACQNNQEWRSRVQNLQATCSQHTTESLQILPAFDNDIKFQDHLADSNYTFQYPSLSATLKVALRPLCEFFYEYLDETGYGEEIHKKLVFRLRRADFLKAYQEPSSNGKIYVCPICDKEITDENRRGTVSVQLDHFFPKSIYPFLAVHPYNLIPGCSDCNVIYKGDKDPLKGNTTGSQITFLDTYHAHKGRSIRDMGQIVVKRIASRLDRIEITIEENTQNKRSETAERVYGLSTRWTKRLHDRPAIVEDIIYELTHQAKNRRTRYKHSLTISLLLEDLQDQFDRCRVMRLSNHTIRRAYVLFALENSEEYQYLFREYSRAGLSEKTDSLL